MMILLSTITNINAQKSLKCDEVLDKCYNVVESQKKQIELQENLIKKQDEKIKSIEEINKELDQKYSIIKVGSIASTVLFIIFNSIKR